MTDGPLITQSLQALSSYASEIDLVHATLGRLFTERLKEAHEAGFGYRAAGRPEMANRWDASEWFCTDVAWSQPLCARRRRKDQAEMYIGFQISLAGNGTTCTSPPEPLLHVFFWDVAVDFEGYWVGFPRDGDSQLSASKALVYWEGPGADLKLRQWTFSVKLLSLRSSADLQERVVGPAFSLMRGGSDQEALPLDFEGLVRHVG